MNYKVCEWLSMLLVHVEWGRRESTYTERTSVYEARAVARTLCNVINSVRMNQQKSYKSTPVTLMQSSELKAVDTEGQLVQEQDRIQNIVELP